ncbi:MULTISPECIES: hypothetical protein [unclassified Microbacterium]|uniref:hypothetical protein n=1 Tax=unclassified Microbacterium TaxID=2609290 RepID=UPI0030184695
MIRWVVIEWNQASSQPSIAGAGELHWNESDAEDLAEALRERTRIIGRRERYTVQEIDFGDDW